jgi:hypothetical protein
LVEYRPVVAVGDRSQDALGGGEVEGPGVVLDNAAKRIGTHDVSLVK